MCIYKYLHSKPKSSFDKGTGWIIMKYYGASKTKTGSQTVWFKQNWFWGPINLIDTHEKIHLRKPIMN